MQICAGSVAASSELGFEANPDQELFLQQFAIDLSAIVFGK